MSESTTTTAPAGAAPTGSAFVGCAVLNPSRGVADSLPPDMIVHGSDLFWPLVSAGMRQVFTATPWLTGARP
jgi:hypothetical protein